MTASHPPSCFVGCVQHQAFDSLLFEIKTRYQNLKEIINHNVDKVNY